jgi:Calcineurin-like phosphoesterase
MPVRRHFISTAGADSEPTSEAEVDSGSHCDSDSELDILLPEDTASRQRLLPLTTTASSRTSTPTIGTGSAQKSNASSTSLRVVRRTSASASDSLSRSDSESESAPPSPSVPLVRGVSDSDSLYQCIRGHCNKSCTCKSCSYLSAAAVLVSLLVLLSIIIITMGVGSSKTQLHLVAQVSPQDLAHDDLYAAGKAIRVVVMSDTHDRVLTRADAKLVPDGDVFIHCGDMTENGSAQEIEAFNQWLGFLPHMTKIVIAGNHDLHCDPESYFENVAMSNKKRRKIHHSPEQLEAIAAARRRAGVAAVSAAVESDSKYDCLKNSDCMTPAVARAWREILRTELLSHATHYLEGEQLEVDIPNKGQLRLAGIPYTDVISVSSMRAFAISGEEQTAALNRVIPHIIDQKAKEPLDILVTHGPPHGVLDSFLGTHAGSSALALKLASLAKAGSAPRFHLFGHVHGAHGAGQRATLDTESGTVHIPTTFINAAAVKGRHQVLRRPPAIYFDVVLNDD